MAATAEAAATVAAEAPETAEVAEMAEATKAAEWGGNHGGRGSKNHIGGEGNVCTNVGAGSPVATSTRLALAAHGAPRERHEDECWVADSGAIDNMTQDSSHLEGYTPAPPGDEVESAGGVFLPVAGYGRLRLLVDQDNNA